MMQHPFGAFCDHLDVRVSDLLAARTFYDPFCASLGLTEVDAGSQWVVYESPNPAAPFLAITAEEEFGPCRTRAALRGASKEDVDRIARAARDAGATRFVPPQLCPEYSEGYYAAFFDDPDGNRYEICHRAAPARVARIWRGRVPPDKLDEYRQYVAETGLSDYTNTLGNRGAYILTAQREGYGDVTTLSFWESRDAIARFAGEPIERARYYPHDEQYLLEFPENVEHFDLTF
jgi:catechol 2,3-dioxygenase-like lactoylglutathione lyase family enzyme/heme-degrading monooxygenase HmoA